MTVWRFVRGDTDAREFERWLYARTEEFENRLGAQKALDVLSADYGASGALANVRKMNLEHSTSGVREESRGGGSGVASAPNAVSGGS